MDDPSQVIAWATAAVCVQARPAIPVWKKNSCRHWWNPCHQSVLGPLPRKWLMGGLLGPPPSFLTATLPRSLLARANFPGSLTRLGLAPGGDRSRQASRLVRTAPRHDRGPCSFPVLERECSWSLPFSGRKNRRLSFEPRKGKSQLTSFLGRLPTMSRWFTMR